MIQSKKKHTDIYTANMSVDNSTGTKYKPVLESI